MRGHMLNYHVLLPAGAFLVLLAVGVPVGTALRVGVAAGCISMVAMMATGGHRRHDRSADHPARVPQSSEESRRVVETRR